MANLPPDSGPQQSERRAAAQLQRSADRTRGFFAVNGVNSRGSCAPPYVSTRNASGARRFEDLVLTVEAEHYCCAAAVSCVTVRRAKRRAGTAGSVKRDRGRMAFIGEGLY
jgi:hypothetical protein